MKRSVAIFALLFISSAFWHPASGYLDPSRMAYTINIPIGKRIDGFGFASCISLSDAEAYGNAKAWLVYYRNVPPLHPHLFKESLNRHERILAEKRTDGTCNASFPRKFTVLKVSDGWETGEPQKLFVLEALAEDGETKVFVLAYRIPISSERVYGLPLVASLESRIN